VEDEIIKVRIRNMALASYSIALRLPLGLKWESVGTNQPIGGKELTNSALASDLNAKLEFTQKGWDTYKIDDLQIDHYIKSQLGSVSSYFKPTAIEDEPLLDEELLIKVFERADIEKDLSSAKLNQQIKEVERTLKPGMICECEDKETQTCVLRIEIEDA